MDTGDNWDAPSFSSSISAWKPLTRSVHLSIYLASLVLSVLSPDKDRPIVFSLFSELVNKSSIRQNGSFFLREC